MDKSKFQELLARAKATKELLANQRAQEEAAKLHEASETADTVDMTKMGVSNAPETDAEKESVVDAIRSVIENATGQNSTGDNQERQNNTPETHKIIGVARKVTLNEKQQLACDKVVAGEDVVLIGAAGTGKTTSMNQITIRLVESGRIKPLRSGTKWLQESRHGAAIVSFTRKAVNNIRHAVVDELKPHTITLHKLLEFAPIFYEIEDPEKPGEFKNTMRFEPTRNAANPLPSDLTFIAFEESSMISVELHQLLEDAMPHSYQQVFLGDIQQLPPVFGLAILGFKMVELPVVELTEVYRQAMNSPIIRLAHMILAGNPHEFSPLREKYFDDRAGKDKWRVPGLEKYNAETEFGSVFIQPWQKKISPDAALGAFVAQAIAWEKQGYYDPNEDVILCPFNVSFGCDEINLGIANYLGRKRNAIVHEVIAGFRKHYLAVGDRVLYDKEDAFIVDIARNSEYMGARFAPPSKNLDRWGAMQEELTDAERNSAEDDASAFDLEAVEKFLETAATSTEDRVQASSHVVVIKYAFSDETVELDTANEINNLLGGYALTVHKFQGSESNKVFFVIHQSHAVMNSRELLYTAVTRAKRYLHIICEPDTFYKGVNSQRIEGDTIAQKAEFFKGKATEREKKLELEKKELDREGQHHKVTVIGDKPAVKLADLPSPEIRAAAVNSIQVYWREFQEKFGDKVGMQPVLNLNINSRRTLGRAKYRQNLLQLNPVWLAVAEQDKDVYEEMIKDCVLHELAHFVAKRVYGEAGHGRQWKYVMMRMGMRPDRLYTGNALPPWMSTKNHLLEDVFKKFHLAEEVSDDVVEDEEEEVA